MAGLLTERLRLREVTLCDAPFILRLTNEADWLRFIGDKNVRSLDDAGSYITDSFIASYRKNGFGIWLVELQATAGAPEQPIGTCGLVNRKGLDGVDLGFGFLKGYEGKGYASEAAFAVVDYAKKTLELDRLLAITLPDNKRSISLLKKLNFASKGFVELAQPEGTGVDSLLLFEKSLQL